MQNLREIRGQLFKCEELIGGPLGAAFNDGNILVSGPAGTGKTHLLCEMSTEESRMDCPLCYF